MVSLHLGCSFCICFRLYRGSYVSQSFAVNCFQDFVGWNNHRNSDINAAFCCIVLCGINDFFGFHVPMTMNQS